MDRSLPIVIIGAILLVLFFFSRHPGDGTADGATNSSSPGANGAATGHLNVVPTIRSVTVSPGDVTFGNCTGGGGATGSTQGALGYPNGTCEVGAVTGATQSLPITVSYTGIPGFVYVSGSNAAPSDGGAAWALCTPQAGNPTGLQSCSGDRNLPGSNQYLLENAGAGVTDAGVITGTPTCDRDFDPGGGCGAAPPEFKLQVQHEGLLLTGPKTWDDHSTSWTLTLTWTAVGPSSGG